jgi:hypothetical protein
MSTGYSLKKEPNLRIRRKNNDILFIKNMQLLELCRIA